MDGITRQDLWRAAAFYRRKRLREHDWPAETIQMVNVLEYLVRVRRLKRETLEAGLRADEGSAEWRALSEHLARNVSPNSTVQAVARAGGKALVGSPLGAIFDILE
ncbi:MAG: hypothetical protein ACI8S6_004276 [Myxococcota bacterium]|jgi:hypothetical protein